MLLRHDKQVHVLADRAEAGQALGEEFAGAEFP